MFFKEFYQLTESFKDAKQKWIDDAARIIPTRYPEQMLDELLNNFKRLKNGDRLSGEERDITYWIRRGFKEFYDFVNDKLDNPQLSGKEKKKLTKNSHSIKIWRNDQYEFVIPLTHEASQLYGAGTKWCTASRCISTFKRHFNDSDNILIYCIPKGDYAEGKMAFDVYVGDNEYYMNKIYFADDTDDYHPAITFKYITGMDINEFGQQYITPHMDKIEDAKVGML